MKNNTFNSGMRPFSFSTHNITNDLSRLEASHRNVKGNLSHPYEEHRIVDGIQQNDTSGGNTCSSCLFQP